jgi:hypothetical protein
MVDKFVDQDTKKGRFSIQMELRKKSNAYGQIRDQSVEREITNLG